MKKLMLGAVALCQALLTVVAIGAQDWVKVDARGLPERSLVAGNEADGTPLYIIRAPFQGGVTPGKYSAAQGKAYIPWGGEEKTIASYEIYVGTGAWQPATSATPIPPAAVAGGKESDGSILFVVRSTVQGSLVPGKYSSRYKKAFVPYGGKELEVGTFEFLVALGEAPRWVRADVTDDGSRAQPAGQSIDGTPSYLVRAPFQGGLYPGKFNPAARAAYLPWGGKEAAITSFELYVGPQLWQAADPAKGVPATAVVAGQDADGSVVYAIRARHENATIPGAYSAARKKATVPFGGKEVTVTAFEYLVTATAPVAAVPAPAPAPAPTLTAPAPPPPLLAPVAGMEWAPGNPQAPPRHGIMVGFNQTSVLYLIRGLLRGKPRSGYLDPATMKAYLFGETTLEPTENYEVWTGGGRWADMHFDIPNGALSLGQQGRGERIALVRVVSGKNVLPAYYSPEEGSIVAYDQGKRLLFDRGQVLMPDWDSLPTGADETVFEVSGPAGQAPAIPYRLSVGAGRALGRWLVESQRGSLGWQGQEVIDDSMKGEVFVGSGAWRSDSRGRAPDNAIPAGRDADGSTTYLARTVFQNTVLIGTYNERLNVATFPWNGQEIRVSDYKVLCYPLPEQPQDAPVQESLAAPGPAQQQTLTWSPGRSNLPYVRPSTLTAIKIAPLFGFWSAAFDAARLVGLGDAGRALVFQYEGTVQETLQIQAEAHDAPRLDVISPSGRLAGGGVMGYGSLGWNPRLVLPETGTYTLIVSGPTLDRLRIRVSTKAQPGALDARGTSSQTFAVPESGLYSFSVVADGWAPQIQILDAATKAVVATSGDPVADGKMAVVTPLLKAGQNLIVTVKQLKSKAAKGNKFLLSVEYQGSGDGGS